MKRCMIICAGKVERYDVIKEHICGDEFVICADAGIVHAEKLGLKPDVILGDFDSYTGELPECGEIIRLPVEKDDTDTMYAVKLALERGYREFVFFGALGGRLDHTVANIQTLKYLAENGAFGTIISEDNIVFMLCSKHCHEHCSNKIAVKKREGFKLSVFSYGEVCRGVTLKNVHYPLDNYTLDSSFPLGVSNEFEGEEAYISISEGYLLIILSMD